MRPTANEGFDEYVSDPKKPVPYYQQDQPPAWLALTWTATSASPPRRTDVLTYETAPLDSDVTIAGPVAPTLHVSTTGTDSDFIVKLIDVYPDRLSRSRSESDRRQDGGIRATGSRRTVPRKIPATALNTRNHSRRAKLKSSLPDARCQSLLSTRPPNHGAGAEFLVPAGGSQSPDIYKYSNRQTGGLQDGDRARLPLARRTELFGSRCDPVSSAGRPKRVFNNQLFNDQAVLQILRVQPRAPAFNSACDNQRIPPTQAISIANGQRATVQGMRALHRAHRTEDQAKKALCLNRRHWLFKSSKSNVKELLDHLIADDPDLFLSGLRE